MGRRPRALIVGIAVVVVVGLGGLGAWMVTREGRTACDEFAFDRTTWKRHSAESSLEEESADEKEKRRLARGLVECRLLDRVTKERVRRLLGSPDDSGMDPNPVRHREWSYLVGFNRDAFDPGEEQSLLVEFGNDQRVRYVEAPKSSSTGEVTSSGQAVGEPRVTLPRVVGLPRSEATRLLTKNLRWRYEGPKDAPSTTIRGQWPSPGKTVLQGFRIVLETEGRCDRDPGIPSGFWPRRSHCRNGGQPRDY